MASNDVAEMEWEVCEAPDCRKSIQSKSLIRHISQSTKCKLFYGSRLIEMKAAKTLKHKRKYNAKNQEKIAIKQSEYNKENKIQIASKQNEYNKKNEIQIAKKQNEYNKKNKIQIASKQNEYNKKNKIQIASKQRDRDRKNKEEIAERQRQKRDNTTNKTRLMRFKEKTLDGPIFMCSCCMRVMFINGIKKLNKEKIQKLFNSCPQHIIENATEGRMTKDDDFNLLCHTCYNSLSGKKPKIPSMSSSNGLTLDPIPPELELTDLEQQLIAKTLLFMQVGKYF